MDGAELCFPELLNSSCRKITYPPSTSVLIFIGMSSFSLLTVTLNLLVIISISHFRQLHTPTNLLLLSLAVSDFLVGLLILSQIMSLNGCWYLGDLMCVLCFLLNLIITSASVGTMVLISADRYVAICDPLHYPTKVRAMRSHITAASQQHSGKIIIKKSELKAAGTLGVVVVTFLSCIFPYYCVLITAFDYFRVPSALTTLVKPYFQDVQLCVTTAAYTTTWQHLEVGIMAGCTISPTGHRRTVNGLY
ncbi:trace amine-associated receptor 13c-like [Menidia menidia]